MSSYFEALQRERCSVSLGAESSCIPGVPRAPKRHPDEAAVAASVVRFCSLLMYPPSAEVKRYHACLKREFVGLFVTALASGATGDCWGWGAAFLFCQDGAHLPTTPAGIGAAGRTDAGAQQLGVGNEKFGCLCRFFNRFLVIF